MNDTAAAFEIWADVIEDEEERRPQKLQINAKKAVAYRDLSLALLKLVGIEQEEVRVYKDWVEDLKERLSDAEEAGAYDASIGRGELHQIHTHMNMYENESGPYVDFEEKGEREKCLVTNLLKTRDEYVERGKRFHEERKKESDMSGN